MDKKKTFSQMYPLTREELLENLDRNYIHRQGIQTISDDVAYNQIKDLIMAHIRSKEQVNNVPPADEILSDIVGK